MSSPPHSFDGNPASPLGAAAGTPNASSVLIDKADRREGSNYSTGSLNQRFSTAKSTFAPSDFTSSASGTTPHRGRMPIPHKRSAGGSSVRPGTSSSVDTFASAAVELSSPTGGARIPLADPSTGEGRRSGSSEATKSRDSSDSAYKSPLGFISQPSSSARSRGENGGAVSIHRTPSDASSSVASPRYGTPPDGTESPIAQAASLGRSRYLPGAMLVIDPTDENTINNSVGRRTSSKRGAATVSTPDLKAASQRRGARDAIPEDFNTGKMTSAAAAGRRGSSVDKGDEDTPRLPSSESSAAFPSSPPPSETRIPSSPPVPPKEAKDPSAANTFARARRKTTGARDVPSSPPSSSKNNDLPSADGLSLGAAPGDTVMAMRSPSKSSSNLPLTNTHRGGGGGGRLNTASSDASTVLGDTFGSTAGSFKRTGESVSLAQEAADTSTQEKSSGGGGGLFKGRMKKSGGFLRAFRTSTSRSKSQEPGPKLPATNGAASNTSEMMPGQIETPVRRSSAAHATGSDPASSSPVPVPTVPSKYAGETSAAIKARREKGPAPTPEQPRRPSPSGPAAAAPVRSSSSSSGAIAAQADGSGPPVRPPHGDLVGSASARSVAADSMAASSSTSSAAGGGGNKARVTPSSSDASGQELRSALKAWETEMDDTLRSAAQDLDKKIDLTPRAQWGPSPQLPEIDGLSPGSARSRAGSFMDEAGNSPWDSQTQAIAGDAARGDALKPASYPTLVVRPAASRSSSYNTSAAETPISPGAKTGLGIATAATVATATTPASASPAPVSQGTSTATPVTPSAVGTNGSTSTHVPGAPDSPASSVPGTFRSASAGPESTRNKTTPSSPVSRESPSRRPSLPAANRPASESSTSIPGVSHSNAATAAAVRAGQRTVSPAPSGGTGADYDPSQSIRVIPRRDSQTTNDDRESLRSGSIGGAHRPLVIPVPSSTDGHGIQRQASPVIADVTKDEMLASDSALQKGQEMAVKFWNEEEEFCAKEKIAETLGGPGYVNRLARTAYFRNFNFEGMRVDVAFRKLCDKLFLKAETQQIDRILDTFSQRFWACNPGSIYGSADHVHSIVFSLLLLNTDLHVADITDRMTRNQFVRNTMTAIADSHGAELANSSFVDDSRSSISDNHVADSLGKRATMRSAVSVNQAGTSSTSLGTDSAGYGHTNQSSASLGTQSSRKVSGISVGVTPPPPLPNNASGSRTRSITGSSVELARPGNKAWEVEMEAHLRDIYAAVKTNQIRLPAADGTKGMLSPNGAMRPGRRSMASPGSDRVSMLKRGSIRGIQGLLGNSSAFNSDASFSPPGSVSTGTSLEVDPWSVKSTTSFGSTGSAVPSANTTALGFASTLTHTIIKESQDEDADGALDEADEMTDEELALLGAPWAKEGVLTRKHYWESSQKRAKDKNWVETFVVVQKGIVSMFRFGEASGSQRAGTLSAGAAVGGGNWLSNATSLGTINLAHTLSNVLPPPGYNRSRPHVFAITLPGGAVYFFQAGHEELVHEWVSTCNYWAARQSKEPLSGGVSNMEYGWNKVLPSQFDDEMEEQLETASIASGGPTANDARSIRSGKSGRSSKLKPSGGSIYSYKPWKESGSRNAGSSIFNSSNSVRTPSLLGGGSVGVHANERIYINEWRPPQMPTVASTLKEEEQLERITKYIAEIERELTSHNELRQPMLQLYSPRGVNHGKALANWEKKSNHLLQELVKYQCYADSLKNAVKLRAEKQGQKVLERAEMA